MIKSKVIECKSKLKLKYKFLPQYIMLFMRNLIQNLYFTSQLFLILAVSVLYKIWQFLEMMVARCNIILDSTVMKPQNWCLGY